MEAVVNNASNDDSTTVMAEAATTMEIISSSSTIQTIPLSVPLDNTSYPTQIENTTKIDDELGDVSIETTTNVVTIGNIVSFFNSTAILSNTTTSIANPGISSN